MQLSNQPIINIVGEKVALGPESARDIAADVQVAQRF